MRVLYLIDSLTEGGAERSLAALAPGLVRAGVKLDVAFLHERPGVGPELEAAGARLWSLEGRGGAAGALARARRLRRRLKPDIVHTTLFEADITGRLACVGVRNVKVVGSIVNAAYGPEQLANPALARWKVRATQLLDAATARRVDRFHAVSQTVADVMAERLHVSHDRIDIVRRGRDAEQLGIRTAARRDAARAGLGVDGDSKVILAVGRQEYQKGFDVLVRALAIIARDRHDVRVVVAGRRGGASDSLAGLAHDLGVDGAITMLGARDDVPELMCAADVLAFPSRWEGMPGTVVEAMALELPIVASRIAMVREVVGDGGAARLVPPEDPPALARAIEAALDDDTVAEQTALLRARFLECHTLARAVNGMVGFYERVLGRSAGA